MEDYTKEELLLLLILERFDDKQVEEFYKELEEGQEDESGKGS